MQLKNNKGAALITVLIALVVLSILGIALMSTTLADGKQAIYHQDKIQSNYLARSAVDDIASHIITTHSAPSLALPVTNSLDFGNYTINKIQSSHSNTVFYIEATGTVNGTSSVVGLTISKDNNSDVFDKAIYTLNDLDISGMKVEGNIGSGGKITISENTGANFYDKQKWTIEEYSFLEFEYSQIPVVDSYKDNSNSNNLLVSGEVTITNEDPYEYRYTKIDTQNNSSNILIFDTKNEIMTVGVTIFENGNQSKVIIGGGGLLKLYIYDTLDSKGDFTVIDNTQFELILYKNAQATFTTPLTLDANPNKVRMYLDADSKLHLQANCIVNGYIYGPEAEILMQAGAIVNGAIIGDVLSGQGNQPGGSVNYISPDDSWTLDEYAFNKRFYE